MSAPFLSPRGEGSRCTICTAFSAICARGAFLPAPVGVRELGDDIAAFLQCVERERHVELAVQRRLHADLDVVVIDEHGDLQFFLHS